ncbi:MAG: electron transport complex subunit RsxC [Thermotogae bacterium]|nr:electron transport complex subunit RsxC [Thermotogota bacterium]
MNLFTFRGGVHPPESKELTEEKPIRFMPLPQEVKIYLANHGGAPAKRVVKEGDTVKTGQKIGEQAGMISANVHASLTGTVVGVEKVFHPVLQKPSEVVVIRRETEKDEWEYINPHGDFNRFKAPEIVDIIKEAGIVGLGGAMFPTHVKLTPPEGKKIDLLIVNGAECEPYLTIDHRLMLERTEDIVKGIRILMYVLDVEKAYVGIENNKLDAYEAMMRATAGEPIKVKLLRTKYPQGAEKQLIYALTKRVVPSGGLPLHVGVVVQNVGTVLAVYEAVEKGKPLVERGLTVTGEAVSNPSNLVVRVGTMVSEVLEFVGGLKGKVDRVILGGPMMGIAIPDLNIPVMKGTSGIVALPPERKGKVETKPCIRCSRCVMACPMNLQPYLLEQLARARRYDEAVEEGLMDCIECGSCSYICPSKIDHVKSIKLAKKVYRALRGGARK